MIFFIIPIFFVRLSAYLFIGYWIALQAFEAYLSLGVSGGGVAFFAHVGGFVTGLVLGLDTALLDNNGDPLNGTGLPANCWPN